MSFTLARRILCSDEGCHVQFLDGDSAIDAPLSPCMLVTPYRSSSPTMRRWRFATHPVGTLAGDHHTIFGQQSPLVDLRPKAAFDPTPHRQYGDHVPPARQRRDRKLYG